MQRERERESEKKGEKGKTVVRKSAEHMWILIAATLEG
jgi:hypothetical protein